MCMFSLCKQVIKNFKSWKNVVELYFWLSNKEAHQIFQQGMLK